MIALDTDDAKVNVYILRYLKLDLVLIDFCFKYLMELKVVAVGVVTFINFYLNPIRLVITIL